MNVNFMRAEKERINSSYFLHHSELKKKKTRKIRKETKKKVKKASFGLGAMFERDSLSFVAESNSTSDYSDED